MQLHHRRELQALLVLGLVALLATRQLLLDPAALLQEPGALRDMLAMDQINHRWGRDTLYYAGTGQERAWAGRQAFESPAYTTDWEALPRVGSEPSGVNGKGRLRPTGR